MMKQLKSFDFTDAQRKKLASIILKLDKEKQDILISGDNIATINGQSLLNGGNISLIKTGIFTIVTELPTNDIDKDKVYLVPSTETNDENRFSEYIYTDNGWEKLGTFTAKIDLSNYVQKTDIVTDTTNGLMLASDKVKLDAFEEAEQYTKAPNLPDSVISNIENVSTYRDENIIFKCIKNNLIDGSNSEFNMIVPAATGYSAGVIQGKDYNKIKGIASCSIASNQDDIYIRVEHSQNTISIEYPVHIIYTNRDAYDKNNWITLEQATHSLGGIMSTDDKVKLDSLKNYKAGNGINIAGDTISCTLDTSLYSIVTELPETGLSNKIYLLPSTKTEEGNIYTEYGYVDNKWEEIGKYKADVDLTPYNRALNLPYSVIKGDEISFSSSASKVMFDYKPANLDTGGIPDYKTIDFPKATTSFAGTMSASDKQKLDAIEAGAQVNTIESISVNGTPLEVTDKGVNIPIHEYTAGDGIKLENGKFSLNLHLDINAADGTYWGGNMGCLFPIYDNGQLYRGISIRNIASYVENRFDLGLLSTVDYKKFKAKQDALTEVQLNNINNAITSISVNDVEQVNTNGTVNLTIPNATTEQDGMMSKTDKTKINALPTRLIYEFWLQNNKDRVDINYLYNQLDGSSSKSGATIYAATTSEAGLMSADDKGKLDSQPTIKASDATGVTDNDYVVIKKSELNSILSRLSALENKA